MRADSGVAQLTTLMTGGPQITPAPPLAEAAAGRLSAEGVRDLTTSS
jgi:hypothetical protein